MIFILSLFFFLNCNTEDPLHFTEEVLNETFKTLDDKETNLNQILNTYKGKIIMIDVWASWCGDCIRGMPTVKEIQTDFPDVAYVFLSVDKNEKAWKRGIEKYKIEGDHYFLPNGNKGHFGKFLNSNWIPHYMVINPDGSIKLFKAKKATDPKLRKALL